MIHTRRSVLRGGLIAASSALLVRGDGSFQDALVGRLSAAAGSPQGVYYAWLTAWKQLMLERYPRLEVTVLETAGSLENIRRLQSGSATLGLSTVDVAAASLARSPDGPDRAGWSLKALARLYDDYVHVIVHSSSGLSEFSDLNGHSVAIGVPGSGTMVIARRIIGLLGRNTLRTRQLGLQAGLDALAARTVDAVIWSGGVPTPAIENWCNNQDMQLLSLGGLAGAMHDRYQGEYRVAAIPIGAYGLRRGTLTIACANLLLADARTPRRIVEASLATLFDGNSFIAARVAAGQEVDRRAAIGTEPIPLDRAAAAYYRTTKI